MDKYVSERLEVAREAINLVIEFIDNGTSVDKVGNLEGAFDFIVKLCGQNNVLKLASARILDLQNYIDESMEEK